MKELEMLALLVRGIIADPEFPQEIKSKYDQALEQLNTIVNSAETNEDKAALGLAIIMMYPKFQKLSETIQQFH